MQMNFLKIRNIANNNSWFPLFINDFANGMVIALFKVYKLRIKGGLIP